MPAIINSELGSIVIDNSVIANIAGISAMESYGIVGMASKNAADGIFELLKFENINDFTQEKLLDYIYQTTLNKYEEKEKQFGEDNMREVERVVLLRVIDTKWMEHIDSMDQMRKEIGVRAMGNDDPVRAYTNSGFEMYEEMTNAIQEETVRLMMGVEIRQNIERKQVLRPDSENLENAEDPDQATNRAERRRLKREAKKGNIKGN